MQLLCESRLDSVSLYARGAHVQRMVELPEEVPPGDVCIEIHGLPVIASGGSFRAHLADSKRQVVSVSTVVHMPEGDIKPSEESERARELAASIQREQGEIAALESHARLLADLQLAPALKPNRDPDRVQERIEQAVETSALLQDLLAEMDARLLTLRDSLTRLMREQQDAALQQSQASSQPKNQPERRATILLAGDGAGGRLTLVYTVPARWWPRYTVNLWDQAHRAEWTREALVAQLSGEDWNDVELSLSTADLVDDMRLPELPALRLGKVQPPGRKALRPPPSGLEALFGSYDGVARRIQDEVTVPTPQQTETLAEKPLSMTAPGGMAGGGGAAVRSVSVDLTPQSAPAMSFARKQSKELSKSAPVPLPEPVEELLVEGADDWLDFDRLVMEGPDGARRGHLVRATVPGSGRRAAAADQTLEMAAPPQFRYDPRDYRGAFDRIFKSRGPVQIPADGLAHRVTLDQGEGACESHWRTVPRSEPLVFREVEVLNPFSTGLMPGPVDVLVEGTLLLTSFVGDQTGAGGRMRVGLGIEDRLRVARNVRIEEEKGGFVVEGTTLEYTVTIEVASALGMAVDIEVIDRLPVTEDKSIKIKVLSSVPDSQPYTQNERGNLVRGGVRWTLSVPPGGRSSIEYKYRISFAAKNELVGGSRRD